jgi:cytochrome P450
VVRKVLRNADGTRQAGFNSEMVTGTGMQPPVLFQDGPEHREQRTAIARFFTPKTVDLEYRALMEELSDTIVARLRHTGHGDLSALSMDLAVQVAARVVGLTDSKRPGLARRLDALLAMERLERVGRLQRAWATLVSRWRLFHFYVRDVRPAILARRQQPREDVISHLLAQKYNHMEILIECVTYGAAGMATTREFICMAAWHLLEVDSLRHDYLAAEEGERHRILHEILRLEPVVGHLYRRTTEALEVEHAGVTHRIPAGALLDLDIRAVNVDLEAVGEAPLALCPERDLARGVQPAVMSFGDGSHRCPGAFIAIQESDIFLQRLLRLPVEQIGEPRMEWNDLIESYELRDFYIVVGPSPA